MAAASGQQVLRLTSPLTSHTGKAGGGLARVHCRGDLNGSRFMDNSGATGAGAYLDGCIADNLSDNQFTNSIVSATCAVRYSI